MSKLFINRPIVAIVIPFLSGYRRRVGWIVAPSYRAIPEYRDPQIR